jgi:host factor-I protein
MAGEKPVNVQDVFLNHVRKNKTPLTVFLINGVKLQGVVTWFDQSTMLLRREGHSQLVYKHAISTIMPQGSIVLFDHHHGLDNGQDVMIKDEETDEEEFSN